VVWHFINPEQIPMGNPVAFAAALAAAALVGVGVFQELGPAEARERAAGASLEDDEAAARLIEQLRQGRAVSWAGPVYLLPAGVQANGRVYRWDRIDAARAERQGRQLLVYVKGQEEPVAEVSTKASQFAAGWRVFEELARPDQDALPARVAA
jgi:hypothetical protein